MKRKSVQGGKSFRKVPVVHLMTASRLESGHKQTLLTTLEVRSNEVGRGLKAPVNDGSPGVSPTLFARATSSRFEQMRRYSADTG